MSLSLYYTAKRDYPISKQEQDACQQTVERYIANYPLGDMYESFCVYNLDMVSEENIIFQGATKLPLDEDQDHFIKVHDYWSDCLQEIINLLPDAQWDIHID
ncbi:MAG: hypothetical protein K2M91_10335 [Lachnospiraceae bacterium]|nr:hypothetical protein [Lachnospiraceae bacterium]